MDKEELTRKIRQIEEQASEVLAEFPKNLTKERLRMILALARYIRTELDRSPGFDPGRTGLGDAEDTVIPGA